MQAEDDGNSAHTDRSHHPDSQTRPGRDAAATTRNLMARRMEQLFLDGEAVYRERISPP